jgi:hypothetical protein
MRQALFLMLVCTDTGAEETNPAPPPTVHAIAPAIPANEAGTETSPPRASAVEGDILPSPVLPDGQPPATQGAVPPLPFDASSYPAFPEGALLPGATGELPFPSGYPLPDPTIAGQALPDVETPNTATPGSSTDQAIDTSQLFNTFANRWQPLLSSPDGTPFLGMNTAPAGGGFFQNPLAAVGMVSLPDGMRSRLGLGTSLSGVYSTNPTMGYTGNGISPSDSGEGDFSMTLGGNLSYGSGNSDWTYSVAYSGGYSHSFNLEDLSGYSQSASASLSRDGGRWNAMLGLSLSIGSGANRQYQAVVDETSLGISLGGSYEVSPKTSINASLGTSVSIANGGNTSGSDNAGSLTGNLAAMWRYSPLLQFGPGLRFSQESGDNGQDRTSVGPTINANYRLSRKISVNGQIGLDFAQYDGGTSDPSVSTSIGAAYAISKLWSMNASLSRGAQADMSGTGGFNESTSFNLAAQRRIRKASLSAGLSYAMDDALSSTGSRTSENDRRDLGFNASLTMPIFAGRASASTFLSTQDQSENKSSDSGNFTAGFSISYSF